MRNDKYYYCYSYPLKAYIMNCGEKYIVKGVHPESHKKYWVFERNETLNDLLEKWKNNKPE